MSARIAVVVVTWNGIEDTRSCVASILEAGHPGGQVYVVDNGSDADEASQLQAEFAQISVVRLDDNYGYAAAANAGIAAARRDGCGFVLLLNNDTTIDPETIPALEAASRNLGPKAILAPLIVRPDGLVWSAGGALRWPWVAGTHIGIGEPPSRFTDPAPVAWASGCALFAPMHCFDATDGLDERYFLYLEDVDWCLSAKKHGYTTWCVPQSRVLHAVTKTVNSMDPRISRYYAYRNFYLVGMRHAPLMWRAWLAGHLAVALAKTLARNALSSQHRHDTYYNARTRGLLDFVRGRTGKAPYAHRIEPLPQPAMSEVRA
jgi:GT2 family glycosyltransferase